VRFSAAFPLGLSLPSDRVSGDEPGKPLTIKGESHGYGLFSVWCLSSRARGLSRSIKVQFGWFMESRLSAKNGMLCAHKPFVGRAVLLRRPDIWAEQQLGPTRFMESFHARAFGAHSGHEP
jgi:hypothetical protein